MAWPYSFHRPSRPPSRSVLTPQVWESPALTEANSPAGGSGLAGLRSSAPAGHRAVPPHPAGVVSTPALTEANCSGPRSGVDRSIIAPAGNRASSANRARVPSPGADGGELPGRRGGLAISATAPAVHRAVGAQNAGVVTPGADGGELPGRRRGDPAGGDHVPSRRRSRPSSPRTCVVSPLALTEANSPDRGRGLDRITVRSPQQATEPSFLTPQVWTSAAADGGELPGRTAWPGRVSSSAPTGDGTVPPHPAGVESPGAHRGEFLPAGGVDWPSSVRLPQHDH